MILVNALQSLKALSPILVTLLGIVILVNALHPLKALSPILVNWLPSAKVTLVNEVQFQKANLAIPVTGLSTVPTLTFAGISIAPETFDLSEGFIFPLSSILQLISFVVLLSTTKLLCVCVD